MIQHILFDFDGTIADSRELAMRVINEIAVSNKINTITEEEFRELIKIPLTERFKKLKVPMYKIPKFAIEAVSRMKGRINEVNLIDGIEELVHTLKKNNYKISILSSNSKENIIGFLKVNNLNIFDFVYSEKNLFGKDKSIKKFLKSNNLKNDEILYIGDEMRDIDSCKKIGVKIIAVTWGYDSFDLLSKGLPEFIVHNPCEVLGIIEELGK